MFPCWAEAPEEPLRAFRGVLKSQSSGQFGTPMRRLGHEVQSSRGKILKDDARSPSRYLHRCDRRRGAEHPWFSKGSDAGDLDGDGRLDLIADLCVEVREIRNGASRTAKLRKRKTSKKHG